MRGYNVNMGFLKWESTIRFIGLAHNPYTPTIPSPKVPKINDIGKHSILLVNYFLHSFKFIQLIPFKYLFCR